MVPATALTLIVPSIVAGVYYQVFRTQCFTAGRPAATFGLREVSPASNEDAVELLETHHRDRVPLVFRNGSAMHGWAESCWSTECLRKRFGDVSIEGGYSAILEDYLDTFFDGEDPPLMKVGDVFDRKAGE
eukprot:s2434_g1.t1